MTNETPRQSPPHDGLSGAVVMDGSFLTRLRVTGADRGDYLNRRLSQKVDDLTPGEGRRAALLDGTGKMQADMEVFAREEDFLVIAPPWRGETLAAELDKYVFSEDVAFDDIAPATCALVIWGPEAEKIVADLGLPLPEDRCARGSGSPFGAATVLRSGYALGGLIIVADADRADDLLERALARAKSVGGGLVGFDAYDRRRVLAGIPYWGVDLDDSTIPLEADLFDAIHFDKGCYPGQETIARITNLGHPARKLVRFVADAPDLRDAPEPGELTSSDGKPAGRLTSVVLDGGELHALAMVKWMHRFAGTELLFRAGDKSVTGRVADLKWPAE